MKGCCGMDVSLPIAFGAGFLSFFSPCILPLIPVYIMYMTGVSLEDDIEDKRALALRQTFGFIIGFTIIFMIMGTSASFIGRLFVKNKALFSKTSGLLIIIFGLSMMGIFKLKLFNIGGNLKAPKAGTSWIGSILMGMAFAAGWSPCFGPVLASILIYAGGSATVGKGVYLLFIYSLGMAVPFILTALFINTFSKLMIKGEKIIQYIPKVGGLIMVVFGILVFFDKVIVISQWLL